MGSWLSLDDLPAWPDADVDRAFLLLQAEQRDRRLASGEPAELVRWGFATLFRADGTPLDPVVSAGLLVCPGAKWGGRSQLSHRCCFARVSDRWVWDSELVLADEIRHAPSPGHAMRSVTVLSPVEGMAVDMLACTARNSVHVLKSVRSFLLGSGSLDLVSARAVRPVDHR